jgi:Cu(I)/Ag(I) efflux system membrane fusion protein
MGMDFLPVRAADIAAALPPLGGAAPSASAQKRILYYRNPMGLADTSPVPKKDGMGMDYIPVHEGEDDESATVRIAPGKLQRTGVRSEPATTRAIVTKIRVPGAIQLDERRITLVSTRSTAFIEKVAEVTTGEKVKKGQTLFRFYSPEIASAAAQYFSNPGFEGARKRLDVLDVPAEFIAEIDRARKIPLSLEWRAPRDGIVFERNAYEGMKAEPGQQLFKIVDLQNVWALVDVAERDYARIKPGQKVSVQARGMPDRVFAGVVSLVYPQINKETRTARVRVELQNLDLLLRPDMYVDAEILAGDDARVVAAPDSAVIDSGAKQMVLLDLGEGRFEPREVKLGRRGGGFVEIREGLAEGEKIVTSANFLIDAESNLKAALKTFGEAK